MPPTSKELVQQARQRITEIGPEGARQRLEAGGVALDVREGHELADGHIPDAVHIPRGSLEIAAEEHEALQGRDTPICVYCQGGGRGALAAQSLQELGYTDVTSIEGGFQAWHKAGYPMQVPATDEEE